jgi:uroporphyrinogen decarboxylase
MADRSARDNIIITLNNKIPDYVPCCPDISNMIPAKMTGKPFWEIYLNNDPPLGLAQVFAIKRLGIDGFSDQGQLDPSPEYNERSKEAIIQTSEDRSFIDTKTTFKTTSGVLTFKTRYYSYQPPILMEKPIKSLVNDFVKLEEYLDPNFLSKFSDDYYSQVKTKMGDSGIICLSVPVPGLHWLHENQEGGLESVVRSYYENPDSVKEVCNLLHEYVIEYVKQGLSFDIDAIQIGASGLLHFQSPKIVRELSLPTMKEIANLAKSEGIPCHLHACGNEKALVEMAAGETKISSVEPLESPPMGDCDLALIKEEFGHKLGLKGNIHTVDVMLLGTPKEVENAVKNCINAAGSNGGYILSTGDQCPKETPIENLRALIKATRIYGQY